MIQDQYYETYEDALKLYSLSEFSKEKSKELAKDHKVVGTSLLVQIINTTPLLVRKTLSELIGIDVLESDKYYDYLRKTLDLKGEKMMEFSIISVLQYENDEGLNGNLISEIEKMIMEKE